MITFTLSTPPSINDTFAPTKRGGKGARFYKKDSARAWTGAAVLAAKAARKGAPTMTGPIAVTMSFRFATLARDIDNGVKAVLDALTKAGVYVDDNRVTDLRVFKVVDHVGLANICVTVDQDLTCDVYTTGVIARADKTATKRTVRVLK